MAAQVKWKKEFSLGIEVLDEQHREIFKHLLALENALEKRDPWHIVQYFVTELRDALSVHLTVEESILGILGYPELAQHRAAHAALGEGVVQLEHKIKDALKDKSGVTQPLVGFFEQWFVRHVLEDDHKYAAFVREANRLVRQQAMANCVE